MNTFNKKSLICLAYLLELLLASACGSGPLSVQADGLPAPLSAPVIPYPTLPTPTPVPNASTGFISPSGTPITSIALTPGAPTNVSWSMPGYSGCTLTSGNGVPVPNGSQGTFALNAVTAAAAYILSCPNPSGGIVTTTLRITPPTNHLIFVSSTTVPGNFGGKAAGSALCQSAAARAFVRPDHVWKAILTSGNSDTIASTMAITMPIVNMMSQTVVAGPTTFYDSNSDPVLIPIQYNELGVSSGGSNDVWTGTKSNGTNSGNDCNSWTSSGNNQMGSVGTSMAGGANSGINWTHSADPGCNSPKSLYCVSFPPGTL